MTARQINRRTPNLIVSQPATVRACQQDRGTPQDRVVRADEAVEQRQSAQFHAVSSAENCGGRRTA
jgi:hypothetical protein